RTGIGSGKRLSNRGARGLHEGDIRRRTRERPEDASRNRAGRVGSDGIEEHLAEVRLTRIPVLQIERKRENQVDSERGRKEGEQEREVDRHVTPSQGSVVAPRGASGFGRRVRRL